MNGLVVGFGALNLDLIYYVEDLRAISSVPFQMEPGKELFGPREELDALLTSVSRIGSLRAKSGGGSAANTITALARMGFSAAFIGKVGQDSEGDFLLDNLRPAKTDWVCRGGQSGVCLVILDRHRDRFLFVSGNANDTLRFEEIDLKRVKNISWVHFSSFIADPPLEAQKRFLEWIDQSVGVSLDPGEIYATRGLETIRPLIERSRILFVTEKEIETLTASGMVEGARTLIGMGPSILVCKRGGKGSRIFSKERDFEVPAIPAKVVDNTGAGDVYNAGFLAGFFLGRSLEESALFATQMASKSVAGYGRESYPDENDLENFFGLRP